MLLSCTRDNDKFLYSIGNKMMRHCVQCVHLRVHRACWLLPAHPFPIENINVCTLYAVLCPIQSTGKHTYIFTFCTVLATYFQWKSDRYIYIYISERISE